MREGEAESLLTTPQARPTNLFGLSREQRTQGPEVAIFIDEVDVDSWEECEGGGSIEECAVATAENTTDPEVIENHSPVPTVCGTVVLVEASPVNWAFREYYDFKRSPEEAVAVDISCENGEEA